GLCEVETTSHLVSLKTEDGAKVVLDVVRALDAAGVSPETLNVREPTLDDVFLELTGHPAEEAAADESRSEPADGEIRTRGAA
ncbi:MAG TPA: daunorubicin/doxorubicin resistance ABC transporter ATP-binding protein DrrA, partial [Acidimicrobiia bacterium]|nr:daunorubicin/doxorubicin resistance ABC transporter ATP-binding protein DrrA [Acidimicrobiia bacterium]